MPNGDHPRPGTPEWYQEHHEGTEEQNRRVSERADTTSIEIKDPEIFNMVAKLVELYGIDAVQGAIDAAPAKELESKLEVFTKMHGIEAFQRAIAEYKAKQI